MNDFNLDPENQAFIETYLSVSSNLSTGTSIEQQRISYEAICRHFNYPHPQGVETRDSEVDGRHGKIKLRHYKYQNNLPAKLRSCLSTVVVLFSAASIRTTISVPSFVPGPA
jgi:hypothetical protein